MGFELKQSHARIGQALGFRKRLEEQALSLGSPGFIEDFLEPEAGSSGLMVESLMSWYLHYSIRRWQGFLAHH